ncbi:MAG: ParB N-terminal domain-containing protein [Lentisphaeria bacterium]|nr:MAG: ParB N-terminal domain-containing protein [Lentisphaeria bacterium]
MQIINMKLSEIRQYEKNPRFNDGAVEAVAKSIKEFGFQQPIVVDKDFVVVVGHTRLKAAEQLGLTEVPVVIAENLTPEQVQAYRIADNKTGEIAEWNYDLLPIELRDLQERDFDLSLLGFDADELDRLLNGSSEENVVAEERDGCRRRPGCPGRAGQSAGGDLSARQAPAHVRRFHQGGRCRPSHERRESGSRFHRSAVWSQLSRSEQSGRPTVGGH